MGNHCIDCPYCHEDTRGLSGVKGCNSRAEATHCAQRPTLKPWPRPPEPSFKQAYDLPWIKDWREETQGSLEEGKRAHEKAAYAFAPAGDVPGEAQTKLST